MLHLKDVTHDVKNKQHVRVSIKFSISAIRQRCYIRGARAFSGCGDVRLRPPGGAATCRKVPKDAARCSPWGHTSLVKG